MAGGKFLGRIIGYVVNELVVEGLANNFLIEILHGQPRPTFQRFAVRTSKSIEEVSNKAAQAREQMIEKIKGTAKVIGSFKRP